MGIALNPLTRRETPLRAGRDRVASLQRIVSASLLLALAMSIVAGLVIAHPAGAQEKPLTALAAAALLFTSFAASFLLLRRWFERQLRSFEALAERARSEAAGGFATSILSESDIAEVRDLAEALESWRLSLIDGKQAFENQRAALAEILDGIGEGVVAINRSKCVVLANRRLSELFGIQGTTIGKSFLEVIRSQPLLAAFDRALAGAGSTDRAAIMVEGVSRQIEMRVFPIATSSEIAAVALFIDVTRIEHLERVRRDFIADFSHEVRTPLAGIRSAVDTFEAEGLAPDQEEHLRKIISRQVTRLERLVDELGELKQIETGDTTLSIEPVHLLRLLEDLADDFSEGAKNRNVRIFVTGVDVVAPGDIQKIQRVFANLIDNAIKHGGKGGEVRLEVSGHEGTARVRVTDSGDGIPREEQERIFNRLYRIDRSRSQDLEGTGLGLAIARHLVQLHRGSISVDSKPGRGATFEVRLPLAAGAILSQ